MTYEQALAAYEAAVKLAGSFDAIYLPASYDPDAARSAYQAMLAAHAQLQRFFR